MDNIFLGIIFLLGASIPLTFMFYDLAIKIVLLINIAMPVAIIASCSFLAWKKNHLARYFIMAFAMFLSGIVARVLIYSGFLEKTSVSYYSLHYGSVFEIVMLSIALGQKINHIRRENEHSQKMMIRHQQEALEAQARLNQAYARFVPQQFLKFLNKNSIEDVKLGDSIEKIMTVLFLDIRSFTRISEQMNPQENFRFLNAIYKRISPIVRKNHGFVDKYIGDAVMALFPENPDDAVRAAIEMQLMIRKFNNLRSRMSLEPISVGIGLHTGKLMLGTIGEAQRMEGTVIADAVNLASRIEGLTKNYQVSILITEELYYLLENKNLYHARKINKIQVKGKESYVTIYEIYDADPEEMRDKKNKSLNSFNTGIDLFLSGKKEDALKKMKESLHIFPDDLTANELVRLIEST